MELDAEFVAATKVLNTRGKPVDKKETAEAILVMQAWIDDKGVQQISRTRQEAWIDYAEPAWQWGLFKYRIKPSPREFWITIEPPGETLVAWSQKPQNINGDIIKVCEVLS